MITVNKVDVQKSNSQPTLLPEIPLCVKPSNSSQITPWLAALAYPLGRFLVLPFYFFRGITIIGQENLPKTDEPIILAPTHRSRWDSLMIPYATGRHVTGRDLHFMVTINEMRGIQGWFIRHLGGFEIDQKRPTISSLRQGVELLKNRQMLVIFPEGNIFQDQEVHPLKNGLARMAIQAESSEANLGVKIVPISLHYSPHQPCWGSPVKIVIGRPILVRDYLQESHKKAAQLLTTDLQSSLERMNQNYK